VSSAGSQNTVVRHSFGGPWLSLATYLLTPEAQTFAFAVATYVVLAFFPFMIVIIMIIRRVLESHAMDTMLLQILRDHLPTGQDVIIRALNGLVKARKQVQIGSLVVLFLATRGVFMPLEVALNRIWGFPKTRGWLHNLGTFLLMKLVTTAASIGIFFLIYWLVPSGKISVRSVLPAAIIFGILWELMKYAYIAALPHMNFQEVYGPFAVSVALIFWAYLSGLLLLSGAYSAAYTKQ